MIKASEATSRGQLRALDPTAPCLCGSIRGSHRQKRICCASAARAARTQETELNAVTPHPPSKSRRGGARRDMPRILIVDGNAAAANALASLVETAGHGEARVASSGHEALALAVAFVPTVVLLSLDLPDVSGYSVARHLSQHPGLRNLRLIALSGSSEHPGRERARKAGFERYLIDPPHAAQLDELFS